MKVEVSLVGGHAASRIDGVAARATDLRPAVRRVHTQLMAAERGLFASRGHGKWAPITSPGRDPRAMRESSALFHSLTRPGAGQRLRISRLSMLFGSRVPYAARAQRGRGGTGFRKLIDLTPAERAAIPATVRRYVIHAEA